MANSVTQDLSDRIYAIADTIGTTVYLDKGALYGQVAHNKNFSGVKVKMALTIIDSALTQERSAALVQGPGNLLFLVLARTGSPDQLHILDAAKLKGSAKEVFKKSKTDQAETAHLLSAVVASFNKSGKTTWERYKKAD